MCVYIYICVCVCVCVCVCACVCTILLPVLKSQLWLEFPLAKVITYLSIYLSMCLYEWNFEVVRKVLIENKPFHISITFLITVVLTLLTPSCQVFTNSSYDYYSQFKLTTLYSVIGRNPGIFFFCFVLVLVVFFYFLWSSACGLSKLSRWRTDRFLFSFSLQNFQTYI